MRGLLLRILIICDHFPSYGSKSVRFLVDALKARGHNVLIASSDIGIKGELLDKLDSRYVVYRYPSIPMIYVPYTYTMRASTHLKHLCERFCPDIIHTQFMMYWLSLSSASLADEGWPVVLTLHGLTLPSEPSGFFGRFALDTLYRTMGARLVQKSSAIICVSESVRQKLHTLYPILNKRMEVIPNGLARDEPSLKRTTPSEDMKAELGIRGKKVFIYLGRIVKDKGVLELAQAFRAVRRRNKNVSLLVVGDGPDLAAMKNMLDGTPDVCFAGYRSNVGDYLGASDIAVLPSYREGLPTSLLEAMYAGLPFISTMVGGIQDLQNLGAEGCIVPAKSVGPLADAMSKLAKVDGVTLSYWGSQNKDIVSSRLMWDALVERLIDLYQWAIDNRH